MLDSLVSLTYPLHLSFVLLCIAGTAALLRRPKHGTVIAGIGMAWSLVWSLPVCSDWLRGTLERQNPVVDETTLLGGDAIVVLGGGVNYNAFSRPRLSLDAMRSSRLAAGARAWHAGRAPIVVLSGGRAGRRGISEADVMAKGIMTLGVPASAVLLEEASRNTVENAAHTAELAGSRGIRRILLVTSSVHMPRARRAFEAVGFDVTPVPVPELARPRTRWQRWLPSTAALWRSGRALKEYGGLLAMQLHAPSRPHNASSAAR